MTTLEDLKKRATASEAVLIERVDAPMQVSVTTIDPGTGEVKQGVAESYEELNRMLGIGETLDQMAARHAEAEKERHFREYLRLADEA